MTGRYPYPFDVWVRVWLKIAIRQNGCWVWCGAMSGGYPSITVAGTTYRPHRMIWEMIHGRRFPASRVARHICDSTNCVRHVVTGTNEQNAQDRTRVFGGTNTCPLKCGDIRRMKARIAADLQKRRWPKVSDIPREYLALAILEKADRLLAGQEGK